MSYLIETTFNELALLADELEVNDRIVFSTEDPNELEHYKLNPCEYNLIHKTQLLYEEDYVIVIGLINGHNTVAKDIYILANGDIEDEDARVEGIQMFIEEYYQEYMKKNKDGKIYLLFD